MSKESKNKSTTKNNKKLYALLIFIVIVLITCISVEAYIYLKNNSKSDSLNSLKYVGVLEDGTYYISKAPKNIRFQINSTDNNSYILKDEKGNIIETQIISEKGKNLIESANNYNEGETYYLELVNTNFAEERFKDAKKVKFKIEEPEKANYTLSDKVKFISSDMEIQNQDGVKTIVLNNNEYNPNDILIKGNENEFNDAYKISEIKDGVAYLVSPEIAEIYEDIDLHKESKMNFEDIEVNEEFKDQIKVAVKKSVLYQFLVNESYAAEEPDIDIKIEKGDNDTIKLGISIVLPAGGESFLGISSLANHEVRFNFSIEISNNFITDIEKDENIDLDMSIKEKIDFSITLTSTTKLIDETIDITDSVSHDLVKQLGSYGLDSTSGSPKLCGMDLGMGVPGIDIYFDIYFPINLTMQIELAYNQHIEIIQNIGVMTNENKETVPYSTVGVSSANTNFSIVGKANLKMGLEIDMGISFISRQFAHIGFSAETGLYGDIFATAKVSYDNLTKESESEFIGKIEFGVYNKAKMDAGIDIFFYSKDFSQTISDVKKPIYSYGNIQELQNIIASIKKEISSSNNQVSSNYSNTPNITTSEDTQNIDNNTDIDVGTAILSEDSNVGVTTNDTELQKMLADALNNAINEAAKADPDILVKLVQDNLDERWKILKIWSVETSGHILDWIDPNKTLSFKELTTYIAKSIDDLTVYDTVSGKEFSVRVFRTTDIPFVHHVSMNVITRP